MRRVISLFLPRWPSDRLRRVSRDLPARGEPLVTAIMQEFLPYDLPRLLDSSVAATQSIIAPDGATSPAMAMDFGRTFRAPSHPGLSDCGRRHFSGHFVRKLISPDYWRERVPRGLEQATPGERMRTLPTLEAVGMLSGSYFGAAVAV
jgi:hypothetical protein